MQEVPTRAGGARKDRWCLQEAYLTGAAQPVMSTNGEEKGNLRFIN